MKYNNEQVEVTRIVEQDKPFPGRNIDQMPLLLKEGRVPWTAARFMKKRIDHADQFPDLKSYLDVVPLIAYDSNNRSTNVKVVLAVDKDGKVTEQGRKALELINPNANLTSDYAVLLSDELYDSLPGIIVPRSDLGVLERDLKEEEFLKSKLWRIVLGNPNEVPQEFAEDPNLMREAYHWVRGQTRQGTNLGAYLDNNSENAKLRAFFVNRLGSGSRLYGGLSLNDVDGRFVGYLAPDTLRETV